MDQRSPELCETSQRSVGLHVDMVKEAQEIHHWYRASVHQEVERVIH